MSADQVRFADPEVQPVLGPFLSGSLSWDRFFAAAQQLAALDTDRLIAAQTALVDAVVAGRYLAPRHDGPVSFLDEDGTRPGGTAFGRVVSHDDDLPYALADLDDIRAAKGDRAVRRWVGEIIADRGGGFQGHILLLTVLPRAHRLRTGAAMPGYRAYHQEESRAPGAVPIRCLTLLEVDHDGVPGLIAFEASASSAFELETGLARGVEALPVLVPFVVRARHRGELLPPRWNADRRVARDGTVLFRGDVGAASVDDAWVLAARAAMLRPPARRRALSSAEVWETIHAAGPGDPDLLARSLAETLARWTPARIRAFDAGLRASVAALDVPEALAAASDAFGWLSDDAWEDVRLGVIAHGRVAFEAALEDPVAFAWTSVEPGEALLQAAPDALEARSGERIEPDPTPSAADAGAVVVSRRGGELCLRRWADARTAGERHRAAEGPGAHVLAVRPDLDRARLRAEVVWIAPGPLL